MKIILATESVFSAARLKSKIIKAFAVGFQYRMLLEKRTEQYHQTSQ